MVESIALDRGFDPFLGVVWQVGFLGVVLQVGRK